MGQTEKIIAGLEPPALEGLTHAPFPKITLSHLFTKFVTIPFHSSGLEGHFDKKVLLTLSSALKLRNFDIGMKMIAMAPHHWFVQSSLGFYISFGVGYCFIHSKGNAKTRV